MNANHRIKCGFVFKIEEFDFDSADELGHYQSSHSVPARERHIYKHTHTHIYTDWMKKKGSANLEDCP